MSQAFPPLFGGWTPTYGGDLCKGGHPPNSGYKDDQGRDLCNRCGRFLDLRRCRCGQESHSGALGGVARSFCDVRARFDRADAADQMDLFWDLERLAAVDKCIEEYAAAEEPDGSVSIAPIRAIAEDLRIRMGLAIRTNGA